MATATNKKSVSHDRSPGRTRPDLLPPAKEPYFLQTSIQAERRMIALSRDFPAAATVLHALKANMDPENNSIVISHAFLGKICELSPTSIHRAIKKLIADCWIEVVKLNSTTTVSAYRIYHRVAWAQSRDKIKYARFPATVMAAWDDQDPALLGKGQLVQIPKFPDFHPDAGMTAEERAERNTDAAQQTIEGLMNEQAQAAQTTAKPRATKRASQQTVKA